MGSKPPSRAGENRMVMVVMAFSFLPQRTSLSPVTILTTSSIPFSHSSSHSLNPRRGSPCLLNLKPLDHLLFGELQSICVVYEWRTKLLTTRNGHGQSGWSPIGCEGLIRFVLPCYVQKQGIGKWVVPYRLWMFSHKFEHPMSTPNYFIWTILKILRIQIHLHPPNSATMIPHTENKTAQVP